jgi:hypothetical protein
MRDCDEEEEEEEEVDLLVVKREHGRGGVGIWF